ncbi:MAG: glycosyltransferase family 2 protein [Daejeonella sp.]
MEDLVSIIIPCYNYGFVLAETLKSVQDQVYTNLEVLIIDDGSTDNTPLIAQEFAEKDKRFQYYHQINQGVSVARNLGINYSKGNFIQFLDADDLLSPLKISLQLELMKNRTDVDICYSNSYYFEHQKPDIYYSNLDLISKEWMLKMDNKGSFAVRKIAEQNLSVISSPLLRRCVFNNVIGFVPEMKYTEDWEFWFRCAINNHSFFYYNHFECFTMIRVHPVSSSQNKKLMKEGELLLRKKMTELVEESKSLSAEEKKSILKTIQKQTSKIFRDLIYHTPINDIKELQRIAQLSGWKMFLFCFIKALNKRRKSALA